MHPTIRCKVTRHSHVFQPGNIIELRNRVLEKTESQPVTGYFVPDTGDGSPGMIPFDAVEAVRDGLEKQEAYYGKCLLTCVSNFYKDTQGDEQAAKAEIGIVKPENVRIIHYPDCQQLVFHMPKYAYDAGLFKITNACSEEILEEKPVSSRLNGSTMLLVNTLPYPPGFYIIEADWPGCWTHRIQFIKFTEGFPNTGYENAPANVRQAIKGEEVHLLPPIKEERVKKGPTIKHKPEPGYQHPPGNVQMIQNDYEYRLFDSNGVEMDSGIDREAFKRDILKQFVPVLEYTQSGRGGIIYYKERDIKIRFDWEFGGGNAIVVIYIPEVQYWEAQTKTPLSRRDEILTFLCKQVIRDEAPGAKYKIYSNSISILRS
jgi:hypothetical protein